MAAFLTRLAVERHVASSTQNQAKSALFFVYRHVLGVPLPWLDEMGIAKESRRRPVGPTTAQPIRSGSVNVVEAAPMNASPAKSPFRNDAKLWHLRPCEPHGAGQWMRTSDRHGGHHMSR